MISFLHGAALAVIVAAAAPSIDMAASPSISAGVSAPQSFVAAGKRIAYEDSAGPGKVVVCIPGLGDTRAQYRLLAPQLVAAGYRVIVVDPPGQGESEVGWSSYRPEHIGAHVAALIDALALRDVALVGHSRGAAIATWAAAERPQTVSRLVLIGPFVRNVPIGTLQKLMLRVGFAGPWAPALWGRYYRGLHPTAPPADLDAYVASLEANLREPGRLAALRSMLFDADNAAIEPRLGDVRAAALVVMGDQDSDFKDPAAEAALVADRLGGRYAMVPGAGHYPHAEYPHVVLSLIWSHIDAQAQH